MIVEQKIVILGGDQYIAYLKEVPLRIAVGGKVTKTSVRAFIKKVREEE